MAKHIMVKYEWPSSQKCMDCANSTPDILENSAKLCGVGCVDNNGVECSMFVESVEEEEID